MVEYEFQNFVTQTNSKIIILDRDGVINCDSDDYIKTTDEWQPIPNSLEAIANFNKAGYKVFVATNQSGISRGLYTLSTLNKIHEKMNNLLANVGGNIEALVYCPHGPNDNCLCRKPKSGLFTQIENYLGKKIHGSFAVGDSLRDLQAANEAGCLPILVKTGKGTRTIKDPRFSVFCNTLNNTNIPVYDDLWEFSLAVLKQ